MSLLLVAPDDVLVERLRRVAAEALCKKGQAF